MDRLIATTLDALADSVNMWAPIPEPEPSMTATVAFHIEIAYKIPDTEHAEIIRPRSDTP